MRRAFNGWTHVQDLERQEARECNNFAHLIKVAPTQPLKRQAQVSVVTEPVDIEEMHRFKQRQVLDAWSNYTKYK
jgi:hypothetical protein